jgi:RND family efflux transporter MFP subunit
VKRGDLLAFVEDPALPEAVAESQAESETARADVAAARTALARAERLFAEGIVARREVEETRTRAESAEATLRSTQARVRLATTREARARIVAPFDADVIHLLRRPGELVDGTAATPLLELADVTTLELWGDVPAADLVRLSAEAVAVVTADALPGESVPGKVVGIAPSVDASTSLGTVRVRLKSPGRFRLGLAGRATVTVDVRARSTLVPGAALRRSASGASEVVVCEGDGDRRKASVRAVESGLRRGGDVEIVQGVAPGEEVAVSAVLNLDDGTAIDVSRPPPPTAAQ